MSRDTPTPKVLPVPVTTTEDERSEVRSRPSMPPRPPSGTHPVDRIYSKLREAEWYLTKLDANDPRARLLRLALTRRDEILLDGILAEVRAAQSGR